MSWRDSQFVPSDTVVLHLIDHVIAPLLERYETDTGTAIPAVCTVFCYDELRGSYPMKPSAPLAADPKAQIRLRFRRTHAEGSAMYHAEAIIRDVAPTTGFSGFSCNGRLLLNDPEPASRPASLTTRYNVWNWSGPS